MIDLLFILMCSTPGVHPETTAAIIRVESGFNELAIGINQSKNETKYQDFKNLKTQIEAQNVARDLLTKDYNFDAGLMQINSKNFERYGLTSKTIFDPCINIKVGTMILKSFYDFASTKLGPGQKALMAALSAYNTGNQKWGFKNGYVAKFYAGRDASLEMPYRSTMTAENNFPRLKKDPYTSSMVVETFTSEN